MSPYVPFGFPYCAWVLYVISYLLCAVVLFVIASRYEA